MTAFELQMRSTACRQAAELSRIERVAAVYVLRNGKYIATASDRHLIPGKRLQVYLDGKRVE